MTETTTEPATVGERMTRTFLEVAPEDTIGEVAERLQAADAGSALVVAYGRLVGILTSRDLVRCIASRSHPSDARVREWMTESPQVVHEDTPVAAAARLMADGGFHHLPVVEEAHPVGVVGLRALVRP
ncbi:MAG TPA: CBS domain-containing protein [Gaiellaceae bacterium]|nr:CBS domain-containing protein [Gaiellaceae bacterium]